MARFTLPRDLYHGKGALENLKNLKGKRAIVCVGGGSMKKFGFLDKAVAYMKERVQFGKPIATKQGLQWMVADMATEIEAARLLVRRAAFNKDHDIPYTKEAAMAKLYAAEVAMKVTTQCVQIFGGYGYTREYPVERMMRDAKITEIYEGTSQVQRMVISGQVIGK